VINRTYNLELLTFSDYLAYQSIAEAYFELLLIEEEYPVKPIAIENCKWEMEGYHQQRYSKKAHYMIGVLPSSHSHGRRAP
jgi:hypothetical protein